MTPTIIATTLARVEAHDRAATPGPWVYDPAVAPCGAVDIYGTTEDGEHEDEAVAEFVADMPEVGNGNAALIASYRTDAPLLAAALRSSLAEVERLRGVALAHYAEKNGILNDAASRVVELRAALREACDMVESEITLFDSVRERIAALRAIADGKDAP